MVSFQYPVTLLAASVKHQRRLTAWHACATEQEKGLLGQKGCQQHPDTIRQQIWSRYHKSCPLVNEQTVNRFKFRQSAVVIAVMKAPAWRAYISIPIAILDSLPLGRRGAHVDQRWHNMESYCAAASAKQWCNATELTGWESGGERGILSHFLLSL